MKRQTLILLLVLAAFAVVLSWVTVKARFAVRGALDPSISREMVFGAARCRIPGGFGPVVARRNGAWEIRECRHPQFGKLVLAWEPVGGSDFREACTQWLLMPHYAPGPWTYQADHASWFFKELPVYGQGALSIRKQGKALALTLVFDAGGHRHWLALESWNETPFQKELFDQLALSLRLVGGSGPDPGLGPALRRVPWEGRYRFLQTPAMMFLVMALPMILALGLFILFRKRAGRLPSPEVQDGTPLFLEPSLEVAFLRPFQRKYFDAAVGVSGESLTIYTAGTPFLVIPRRSCAGNVSEGTAWLGLPYLDIRVQEGLRFRKWASLYRAFQGPLTIRIYTSDVGRLKSLF